MVTLLFLILGISDNLRAVDWFAYDMGVRFASSRTPNSNVVVVAIDDAAIQELGSWPWPRDVMARLTENMSKSEPAVIGYTVPFDTRQSTYGLQYIDKLQAALEKSKVKLRGRYLTAYLGTSR